jgi:hypothetical protein
MHDQQEKTDGRKGAAGMPRAWRPVVIATADAAGAAWLLDRLGGGGESVTAVLASGDLPEAARRGASLVLVDPALVRGRPCLVEKLLKSAARIEYLPADFVAAAAAALAREGFSLDAGSMPVRRGPMVGVRGAFRAAARVLRGLAGRWVSTADRDCQP